MLGSKVSSDTTYRTRTRGMSRWGTLGGVFVTALCCLGLTQTGPCPIGPQPPPTPRPVTCTAATDVATVCDDGDPCTDDICAIATGETEGECDNVFACSDADHCTDAGCVECLSASECDNSDVCDGVETCVNSACVAGTALNCDNGDFCDGTETCDAATGCVDGTAPCAATETCNEDTNACVASCDDAGDCNDNDLCTNDACVNNGCANTPIDCSDNVACTTDTCAAGVCAHADNCTAPQTCNTTSGLCEDVPACTTDDGCSDDLFCNGIETCDVTTGNCVAGARPCDDDNGLGCPPDGAGAESCDEGDTAAVCTACPPITKDFTLGQDNLTGDPGTVDDVFNAPLIFNAPGGLQVASLQTGDAANGLAGDDLLKASFIGGEALTPSISGIETIELSSFGAGPGTAGTTTGTVVTLNATNIAGVTSIISVNSTDDIFVNGLQALLPTFGVRNVQNAAVDMIIQYAQVSATASTADTATFSVGSTVGDAVVVTPAGTNNGLETLLVESAAPGPNRVTTVRHVQADGSPADLTNNPVATSLTRINASGAGSLQLDRIPNSVLTIDASGMTANFTLGAGDGSAGLPFAAFHAANQNISQITGGSLDDLFVFGNTLTDSDASVAGQTIDGGVGTDGVQATLAGNITAVVPFRSIENLFLNATAPSSINLTGLTGISSATIDCANGSAAFTLTLLNISGSPLPGLVFRGDGQQLAQVCDDVAYTSTGTGGGSDTLAITVGNRGTALNQTGTTNAFTIGGAALTIPNVENVTLDVIEGPATLTGGLLASTLVSLTATASSNLTLNNVLTGGADTISTLNLGGVMGNATVTLTDAANGLTITGAAGNDNITVVNSAAMVSSVVSLGNGDDTFTSQDVNSVDVINGGGGTDTITGAGGNDFITPGDGNDVVVMTSTIVAAPANTDGADSISGFAVGDRIRFGAAPPALAAAAGDNVTGIVTVGADTVITVDLDTDAVDISNLVITLTGVTLTNANFAIQNTTDIVRIN